MSRLTTLTEVVNGKGTLAWWRMLNLEVLAVYNISRQFKVSINKATLQTTIRTTFDEQIRCTGSGDQ